MCEVEPGNKTWRIMLARRGPTLEYWAGEE
jgi:hypothetical protein